MVEWRIMIRIRKIVIGTCKSCMGRIIKYGYYTGTVSDCLTGMGTGRLEISKYLRVWVRVGYRHYGYG